jgi:hypothetical protein
VHTKFNFPDVSLHGPDDQASYMEIACTSSTVQTTILLVQTLQAFGNYVQPKCNRPDARATPSGRGLVMEAFSATLERWLQLTVRMLGQAVRTPSDILVITFYENIRLGRNWRRWKAKKKLCKLSVQKVITSVRNSSF